MKDTLSFLPGDAAAGLGSMPHNWSFFASSGPVKPVFHKDFELWKLTFLVYQPSEE